MFYCYILLDPTKPGTFEYGSFNFDFEPFYIGKGKGSRINAHDNPKDTKTKKKAKIQKIKKLGLEIIKIKLFENLTESSSFEIEKNLIELVGRNDLGKGPLLNLTNGGDGSSGAIISDEEKENKSKKSKEWWILLKENREKYNNHIKKLSEGVSKSQKGISYEERHGERAEEMKNKRSEWCKENFHKTGLSQWNIEHSGENHHLYGKSLYIVWKEKYGEEEALKRHKSWISNKSGQIPHNKSKEKIAQIDKEGNVIKIWEGYPEGFSKPNVCKVLKGERKYAGGFTWKYI
jgi:hypothetical protein